MRASAPIETAVGASRTGTAHSAIAVFATLLALLAVLGAHSPHDLLAGPSPVVAASVHCHPHLPEHFEAAEGGHVVCYGCLVRLQIAGFHLADRVELAGVAASRRCLTAAAGAVVESPCWSVLSRGPPSLA